MFDNTIFSRVNEVTDAVSEAPVRIGILGLAYCKLDTEQSEIKFLRHVPYHELIMIVSQKRRDTGEVIFNSTFKIPVAHSISIVPTGAAKPGNLAAPYDPSEFPLSEILNLSTLHGNQVAEKNPLPPITAPTPLYISRCAFYTLVVTPEVFQLIEYNDGVAKPGYQLEKQLGYVLGGKINYEGDDGGTELKVEGAFGFSIDLPRRNTGGEYAYDIFFINHCGDDELCRNLMGDDTDFRFYYDVLKDEANPKKKFKLREKSAPSSGIKIPTGVGAEACNVVIIQPRNP